MPLTREYAREILATYITAWETQNPDLIVTIFTPEATYHERVLKDPIPDRDAIRDYWATKVVQEQANITCMLLDYLVDSEREAVTAEWEAHFDDVVQGVRKRMREVAILEFDGPLIASLREYWASEQIGEMETAG